MLAWLAGYTNAIAMGIKMLLVPGINHKHLTKGAATKLTARK